MECRLFEAEDQVLNYRDSRPTYPENLFSEIVSYTRKSLAISVSGKLDLAVDVGCGTGHQSTYPLVNHFKQVIGVDISPAMIDCAKKSNSHSNIDFRLSSPSKISVESKSVSLITVATALHWFDVKEFYAEVDRILVPGGVIAAYCYDPWSFSCVDHPNADELARIFKEDIASVPVSRGHLNERLSFVTNRYHDKEIQIPYDEATSGLHPGPFVRHFHEVYSLRSRVLMKIPDEKSQSRDKDDFKIDFSTTIKKLLVDYLFSTSYVRSMFEKEPEFATAWHKDAMNKFLKAYGSDDINSPLSLKVDMFMLMGRKPL